MPHAIHHVTAFELLGSHTLRVWFADGVSRDIDFSPVLAGELFAPLRDPELFAQVRLDLEARTLVWPGGADFDPATLHDWPEHEGAFRRMAERWAREESAVAM